MYFVYILVSELTGRYYVGQTSNVEDRLRRHNAGTQMATKAYLPWRIARVEQFLTRSEACAREREIKAKKSHKWIEWLISQPVDCESA
jgi:putative endonuclease